MVTRTLVGRTPALILITAVEPVVLPDARRHAFGIWSAMGAAGAAVGTTTTGGLLTQILGWQSIFLVNVPIGVAAPALTGRLLPADPPRTADAAGRLDLPGAVLGTAGLEARARAPLMPLRLLRVRAVTGTAIVNVLVGAAHVPAFALRALYPQNVQHYSPTRSGLAVLPAAVAGLLAARAGIPTALRLFGARGVVAGGLALQEIALAWFAVLPDTVDYTTDVLPAALILGVGLPAAFVGVTVPAVTAVAPPDTGVTAGIVNTAQRIGAGLRVTAVLGLAVVVTGSDIPAPGYLAGLHAGFTAAAALTALGCLLTLTLLPHGTSTTPTLERQP
jgi:predicted MFS family arabinose efflux permease